jgi:hypothetical protein
MLSQWQTMLSMFGIAFLHKALFDVCEHLLPSNALKRGKKTAFVYCQIASEKVFDTFFFNEKPYCFYFVPEPPLCC